jgi:hypothetical protein
MNFRLFLYKKKIVIKPIINIHTVIKYHRHDNHKKNFSLIGTSIFSTSHVDAKTP